MKAQEAELLQETVPRTAVNAYWVDRVDNQGLRDPFQTAFTSFVQLQNNVERESGRRVELFQPPK